MPGRSARTWNCSSATTTDKHDSQPRHMAGLKQDPEIAIVAARARGRRAEFGGPATFHPITGGAHEKIRAGAGRPAGRNRGRGGGSPADGGAAEGDTGQDRPDRL